MPIDYKPLNQRLLEVGARQDCVMCGHHHWAGMGPDQTQMILVPMANELDEWVTGVAVACAGWACTNCGFVRLHALDLLTGETDASRR